MRATYMFAAGDVRVIDIPDAAIKESTDAVVRVTRACICGSDLHPFHNLARSEQGRPIGHEFVGVVEDVGAAVATVRKGDFVIAPFVWSCGECDFCREGLQPSCRIGGFWAGNGIGGGQAEAVRVPLADGTLVKAPATDDESLLASMLTLSDVYGTGFHAARVGGVAPGKTVTVVGDGAVGLMAVLSAKQLGAERIILMGRHQARTDLGREFGATEVVSARGGDGIAEVRELTGGDGTHAVLECVGHMPAYEQSIGVVRHGGTIARVGLPQYDSARVGWDALFGHNITLTGGPAPARAYIERLLPGVLDGSVDPGKVFDVTMPLEDVAAGYAAMDGRTALKGMIKP